MRRGWAVAAAFVLAFGALAVGPGKVAAAPSDWIYNATTHHYYAEVEGVTWADAEALGVRLGGHLVTIDSAAENDWLLATFPRPWLWIGMNDRAQEGTWVWSSGRKVDFTNWRDGEPDDWAGFDPLGEDAGVLSGNEPVWSDISEHWLGAGILELPGRPRSLSTNQLPVGSHDGFGEPVAFGADCYAAGWALDPDNAKRNLTVRVLATRTDFETIVPRVVWTGIADELRPDVLEAGYGDDTVGFNAALGGLIEWGIPYEIRAQARDLQTGEWMTLDGSPLPIVCWPQP
jgi:hypothetical protein